MGAVLVPKLLNAGYKVKVLDLYIYGDHVLNSVKDNPYLKEIKDLNIDGAISIELEYSPEPDKIVEWVTEAYQETNKLLATAGLRD